MSNSIHSIQAANAQTQTEQSTQPPKQSAVQTTAQEDKVSISDSAKQALANDTTSAA